MGNTDASSAWNIDISVNDIIEYNGIEWVISFDASKIDSTNYVTNAFTSQQFKLVDGEWVDTFQGIYEAGYWRLELLGNSND